MPEAGGTATPASFWKKLLRQSARIPLSRRRELLMNTPFLNFMTEREIDWLADAATVTSFRAGERLPDSPYYLIVIGTVELRRTRRGSDDLSDDAAARPGRVFGPGEFYIRRTAIWRSWSYQRAHLFRRVPAPTSTRLRSAPILT